MCFKVALPHTKILQIMDSDERPTMRFIYKEMNQRKSNSILIIFYFLDYYLLYNN